MNRQILDPDKARVIRLQADLVRAEGFFLAGGVGLAVAAGILMLLKNPEFAEAASSFKRKFIDARQVVVAPSDVS